ncbi:MAG: PTS-dependent dihydroxyacetone kinase phosphotransferase subunit DhaM [Candidatus Dormibacteraeota bacterium]|nr:PTS-dependent dihydroxyacetone kinase phosphotransferase subunit DhaM [Candidatus Dormibacteraeota bacterium]MBO0705860.1 PTS-dependent dihydroxyacetone kinase phosphotransferase subunit DhaM [Candidatus Dormibacteraeota bacterium]MBO0759870.1 PTS-dependent dihydroxyacetone kinase phosphotransferase subunit DhaM [Candidatus Dormibacteraeota bacterium]
MSVALVLVSHSRQLGEGLAEMVGQLARGRVQIAVASGASDGGLGTDATAISSAIESVDGQDGVLVLADLGSAVLATESAFELLPPDLRDRVQMADAPLVEGTVAAAVQASVEGDLDEVRSAAEEARDFRKLR